MDDRNGRSGVTSDRACAVDAARATVVSGRFSTDLADLVACPSESQNPAHADALRAYLADLLDPRLRAIGFDCAVHANRDGPPFLVARRIEDENLPTILIYGHGDVIHGQADAWRGGLSPFRLTREGDRLYGRGVADNKGQHLINLLALQAVLETRGHLGFNVTWLIEMAEEIGSPGLDGFCRENRDLLAADALIASDGPRLRPDTPTVFLGTRGAINFDLAVDLRDGAHHSGNWGGLLADPAIILAHALAAITDARGRILIDAWRPTSLTGSVRDLLACVPVPGVGGPDIDADWGEPGLTPAERAYGWNSFAVLAMKSGVPEAPVNAISGQARATCQLRFVVGTDPEAILPALRAHLDAHGLDRVAIEADAQVQFPATRADADGPWVRRVAESITLTAGKRPHVLPNLAGSLPNHCFSEILGLPTVWVPHSYAGCNQHAPDEHVLLPVCEDALGVMAGIWWDIGEPG